jgi:hypothetical protein
MNISRKTVLFYGMAQYVPFLFFLTGLQMIDTYTCVPILQTTKSSIFLSATPREHRDDAKDDILADNDGISSRRVMFRSVANIGTILLARDSLTFTANAVPQSDDATATAIAMKTFVDPEKMFVINIPQRFFAIRRTNQGDLPNAATGSGRRGSSIFNAGDLAKAEVLAIERYVVLF